MKTTIELPDSLAGEAKRLARQQRTTLRELVVEGLRFEIERRQRRESPDFHLTTVSGEGLANGISPSDLTRLAYDLPS